MPKRSRIPADPNQSGAAIVAIATGDTLPKPRKKNPAAVALGRLGGLKGGVARAEKLSKRRRQKIASEAARARWAKRPQASAD